MTPKEKAIELVNKFNNIIPRECDGLENITSEFCALIAVDEILNEIYKSSTLDKYYLNNDTMNVVEAINYYNEVKQEIEKL